jgi:hypothetical protein
MSLRTNINDVQVGNDTKISLVSNTHGRKRLPLAQTCVFTPKKTVTPVGEFDDRYPVLVYETYEGSTVSFETAQADQADLDAMIMDLDPNQAVIVNDPANHQQLRAIYCNYTGRNSGYQYGFEYAEQCRLSGHPTNNALKTETKRSANFEGTRYFKSTGKTGQKAAIQYVRFTDGTPTFATTDDVLMTNHTTATFPNAPVAYALPAEENRGATQNYISAWRTPSGTTTPIALNGNSADGTVDFTITSTALTLTTPTAAGDIVEFFVVVQPATPIS